MGNRLSEAFPVLAGELSFVMARVVYDGVSVETAGESPFGREVRQRARKLRHGFVYQLGIQRFTFAGLISPACILYALSLPHGAGRCISSSTMLESWQIPNWSVLRRALKSSLRPIS